MLKLDNAQVTAYFGGSGVGFISLSTQAADVPMATIPLMAVQIPVVAVTLGDVVALGGFCIVLARFVIDLKERRRKRK